MTQLDKIKDVVMIGNQQMSFKELANNEIAVR